jgi:type II secretory pathway component PulL
MHQASALCKLLRRRAAFAAAAAAADRLNCIASSANLHVAACLTCPTATAAAEPPDEPPAVLLVSQGVTVVPNSSL